MPHTVTIDKLVHGGFGLAYTDAGVVFVPDVLPGENVDIEIVGTRSRALLGHAVAINTPSTSRRPPACRYVGECGGCDWQHIGYDTQVRLKTEIAAECFSRIGKLRNLPSPEVVESPPWRYRARVQFKVDHSHNALGFFRKKTNEVVQIESCPLLIDTLDRLLERQDDILAGIPHTASQLKAIAGSDGIVASNPSVAGLTGEQTAVRIGEKTLVVYGSDFFQANAPLLHPLGTWAREHVGGPLLLDLFGGVGFFACLLGDRFDHTVLVDSDEGLVTRARENLGRNGLDSFSTHACTAERFLETEHSLVGRADCVVLDPPRAGLSRAVRAKLKACAPRTILYVSCNPSTQARDAGFLVSQCGYAIRRFALFDLYPQTHHIESVLLLKKLP